MIHPMDFPMDPGYLSMAPVGPWCAPAWCARPPLAALVASMDRKPVYIN